MAKLRQLISVRRAIGYVLVPAASLIIDHEFGPGWLTAALLTVYITIFIAAAIDHKVIPAPYLRLRKLHADAERKAQSNPMLLKYYERSIDQTKRHLTDIMNDRFEFDIRTVPTLSIDAMNTVDSRCLLTFPLRQSESLLIEKTGPAHQYDEAMAAASARIKSAGGEGVTRVFILDRRDDISANLVDFMMQNIDSGINIRILLKEEAPTLPSNLEALDFGCYECSDGSSWVMILKQSGTDPDLVRYIVDTKSATTKAYISYAEDLIELSISFDEFMGIVNFPVNRDLWQVYFAKCGHEMTPPHGLSDEDAEYIVASATRSVPNNSEAVVLLLGFTPKLIRRLLLGGVGDVISIDQCETKPQEFKGLVRYETESWTNISQQYDVDAVIFDESINNLSKVQLGMFFASVAQVLKPGGLLVGRAMGRFEAQQAEKFFLLTEGQVISRLRDVKGTAHSDFAPLIICLLHARSMGFDEVLSTVNCEKWNAVLGRLRRERIINQGEYENWHLAFNFRLLSPEQDTLLREASKAGFRLAQMKDVEGLYATRCIDTVDFFKIFAFELLPTRVAAGQSVPPRPGT